MNNPIRIRYFLWLAALLLAFFFVNSATLLVINLPAILERGPDWREEFYEWLAITVVGAFLLPLLWYAAWRISSRLLAPLRQMVETSKRIQRGHLSERILVPHTHDEIAELAASLNCALDRYEEVVRRQKQFAGTASHQLRTPLTSIRTTGEIALQHDRDPADYREAIGFMLEEARRLAHNVEQLLLMARLNHDEWKATFEVVELDRLMREVATLYEPLLHAQQIHLTCSVPPDVCVRGQPALLSQVLCNVLDNAIRYTPTNGCITMVAARQGASAVEICVNDSGPGFSSTGAVRHNEREACPDAKGGLGLRIVRDILQVHAGTLVIGASADGGASVRIVLPLSA